MRPILSCALLILMICQTAVAQTAATATALATTEPPSVLVLPFTPPAGDSYQWVGFSVQQVLVSDLAHGSRLKVIAPANAKPAADADEALKAASDIGAGIVVFGQTQVLDKEIRLTGEVLDVATGHSITGLKSTGPIDQLFHLEDAVASQSLNSLPDNMRDDEWRQRTGYAAEPALPTNPSDIVNTQPTYAPSDSSPDYAYPGYAYPSYGYPSYGYSYPYYYAPYGFYGSAAFFFGDNHDHGHDHGDNHGHDHGDYHGHSDFHGSGFHSNSFNSAGNSRGFNQGFSGSRGGATTFGRSSGFSSGFRSGGFSGGGFHGGGFGGGGFHGGGMGGGGFHGGGMGGHR